MSEYGINLDYLENIAIITINRPERLNTLNEIMWNKFDQIVHKLKQNTPRVIILTGAGKVAFTAGFDVNPDNPQVLSLMKALNEKNRTPIEKFLNHIRSILDTFFNLPAPIIAAINGKAYGGGAEIAVQCDMRVIDPGAVICFSETRLGLMPDWGGTPSLCRLVGAANATDLILTTREITAKEALYLGLINRISAPNKALDESIELAKKITQNGPRAIISALEVIRETANLSMKKALEMETEKAISLIASGECFHGITAFLSKKKPEFPD
jgi:enoyl-CoA hydratase/carnithine racemase